MDERIIQWRVGVVVICAALIGGIMIVFLFGEGWKRQYTLYLETPTAPGVTKNTPIRKNGMEVPIKDKVDLLLSVNAAAMKAGADFFNSTLFLINEQKYFASTDGSYVDQDVHRMLGRAYVEVGAHRLGKRELEVQLAGEEPPLREIYPLLAECLWKLGETERARDIADRARRLVPDDPRVKAVLEGLAAGSGGSLAVRFSPGRGTTVTLDLPRR